MLRKLSFIVSILMVFCLTSVKGHIHDNRAKFYWNCNLPAPTNLVLTGVTTNSLSFAWDLVPGSQGYDYELTDVQANIIVQSGIAPSENVTCNNLLPNTEYRIHIWSRCQNGQRSKQSASLRAITDGIIIIDDMVVNKEGNYINQSVYSLFGANSTLFDTVYFRAYENIEKQESYTKFAAVYKQSVGSPSNYIVGILHENDESANSSNGWLLGDQNNTFPISSIINAAYAVFSHGQDLIPAPVIELHIVRNGNNTELHWIPLVDGYCVKMLQPDQRGKIESVYELIQTRVFPNPAFDVIHIQKNAEREMIVNLLDINGQSLHLQNASSGISHIEIPTKHLPNGIYFVRCEAVDGVQNFKIIKSE